MEEIKLAMLKESKHNARRTFDEAKLKELAASIKEKGTIEPIIARPSDGKYEIVCGTRRFRAAALAGLVSIPAIVKDLNDRRALEYQVIENLQREDVHPLEEAEGYEALMEKHGYKSADDIAAKVGKSKAYIYGRLKLCELIPENRKFFYEGRLSPSSALLVARVPAHLQKEAGSKVAHGKYRGGEPMSYREAKEYIHEHFMLQLKEAQFDTKEKGLAGKDSCAECLKRTGNQKELFPDIFSADICTDPGCFEAKRNAHTQRMIARLKEKGKEVVSNDEAKKLFKYESDESPESKYRNIDDKSFCGNKYIPLRQLLKADKDVKTVFAVQPFSGKVIEMVNNSDLPRILRSAGIKTEGSGTVKDIAKAKTENRIRMAKRGFWISKVSTAKDRRCMNVVVLYILLEDVGWSKAGDLLKGKVKGKDYGRCWTIPKLYELGDVEIQKLIIKVISKKSEVLDDDDLEFLCAKLGFSIAKDYTITEAYLQAMTKNQLAKLAKEIGMTKELEKKNLDYSNMGSMKKSELMRVFTTWAGLKDKVPKELAK
jgi:ParB/RepB/Spo0J family partition protein